MTAVLNAPMLFDFAVAEGPAAWLGTEVRGKNEYLRINWRDDTSSTQARSQSQRHLYLGSRKKLPVGFDAVFLMLFNEAFRTGVVPTRQLVTHLKVSTMAVLRQQARKQGAFVLTLVASTDEAALGNAAAA